MAQFRSLLCPVDFSEHSIEALRLAAGLARVEGAALTVVAVAEPLLVEAAVTARYGKHYIERQLRKELEQVVAATVGPSHPSPPELLVSIGAPPEAILSYAARQRSDLIVMGTHGLGGYRKMFFGSVTERVLRRAEIPVLAMPIPSRRLVDLSGPRPRFDVGRIVVPVDFGAGTAAQVRAAASLGGELEASLLLVHVVVEPRAPGGLGRNLGVLSDERFEEVRDQLSELGAAHAGEATVEAVAVAGAPADEIARLATEQAAGLIVMGLTGRDVSASRPGLVAYRVLTMAPVPVLALALLEGGKGTP